ncbi:MAG: type III-B CRISPR module-associated protein Cmr5 [Anaerolineae bacterium]|jgi:CRISPR-associated protein Cmr5
MNSRQRSLEQDRAKRAWECVGEAKEAGGKIPGDYGRLARSISADLKGNGLGQTLAFLRAKGFKNGKPGSNGHAMLLRHLSGWVTSQLGVEGNDLLAWVVNEATSEEYRRATAEAMAFGEWLKRFAEAELPTGDDNGH